MGAVTKTGGRSSAVVPAALSPSLPAGYAPEDLDKSLRKYISVCEANIRHAASLSKRVEGSLAALETVKVEDPVAHANTLTTMYDRMIKAGMNAVKAIDELSRLRSFLAGGPDSRPDLTIKGEVELRHMIVSAVKQMGPVVLGEIVEELQGD
jgi:hypothetical protein